MFQLAMSQAGDSSKVTTRGSRVATSESNQDTTSAQPDRQDIDASDASDDIFAELFPELERPSYSISYPRMDLRTHGQSEPDLYGFINAAAATLDYCARFDQDFNFRDQIQVNPTEEVHQCWDHGCNGRIFSTRGNLIRHQREKSRARPEILCDKCGAHFSRATARNQHIANNSCNRIRRYSNGRERPTPNLK